MHHAPPPIPHAPHTPYTPHLCGPPLLPPAQAVKRLVSAELPGLQFIETSSLHRAVGGSRHSFMTVPPGRDKMDILAEVG